MFSVPAAAGGDLTPPCASQGAAGRPMAASSESPQEQKMSQQQQQHRHRRARTRRNSGKAPAAHRSGEHEDWCVPNSMFASEAAESTTPRAHHNAATKGHGWGALRAGSGSDAAHSLEYAVPHASEHMDEGVCTCPADRAIL